MGLKAKSLKRQRSGGLTPSFARLVGRDRSVYKIIQIVCVCKSRIIKYKPSRKQRRGEEDLESLKKLKVDEGVKGGG